MKFELEVHLPFLNFLSSFSVNTLQYIVLLWNYTILLRKTFCILLCILNFHRICEFGNFVSVFSRIKLTYWTAQLLTWLLNSTKSKLYILFLSWENPDKAWFWCLRRRPLDFLDLSNWWDATNILHVLGCLAWTFR